MSEPESNSITSEELASRVRRVVGRRFRRDPASRLEQVRPTFSPTMRNWTAQGYDFLVISLAIFFVSVLVLNLTIAGSWRERGDQWGDRARWQRELHAWEQQLAKQEQQLTTECQQLAATLITRAGPEEQQQALDQVNELRQRLREANQSLATLNGGNDNQQYANRNTNEDPTALSVAAIQAKRQQLIEQQYAARSQLNAENPALQVIEQQLQELDRQLAASQEISRSDSNNDSRVQVIENQFLRTASSSPQTRPKAAPQEPSPQLQFVEQRFEQLRTATERFLRNNDLQQQSLQQSDLERATAWEQVAKALRAMARACAIPTELQQAVHKQDQLRTEPTLSPASLFLSLGLSLAVAGAIVWHASVSTVIKPTSSLKSSVDEKLSVNAVTKQLGCAPAAIVSWDLPPVESTAELPAAPIIATTGKTLQQKTRIASECLLGVTIAATVVLTLTHGQFGDWLLANPLTAVGRWLGS